MRYLEKNQQKEGIKMGKIDRNVRRKGSDRIKKSIYRR